MVETGLGNPKWPICSLLPSHEALPVVTHCDSRSSVLPLSNQLSSEELEMAEMFFHHILQSQMHKDADVLRPSPKSASVWLNTKLGKDVKHG